MWSIQLAFRLFISCRIFLCSLTLSNTSSFLTWSVQNDLFHPPPGPHFKTFQAFLIYCPKCPSFSTTYSYSPNVDFTSFFLNSNSNVLVKRALFFLNAALAIAILHFILQVHPPSFVKTLPKYLKDSTFSSCFWCIIIFNWNGSLEISEKRKIIKIWISSCSLFY